MAQSPADPPPARRALARAMTTLVVLFCVAGLGVILILPDESKTVGLVYGGF
jgi:hypothetical protein